jgi:hypothetical protein
MDSVHYWTRTIRLRHDRGNKIVGAITESEIEKLRGDDLIRAVERSERVKLHSGTPGV